jgi:hypothetical protein
MRAPLHQVLAAMKRVSGDGWTDGWMDLSIVYVCIYIYTKSTHHHHQPPLAPPPTTTKIKHQKQKYTIKLRALALAGDWLQTTYPSALMERAVSTGMCVDGCFLILHMAHAWVGRWRCRY